MPLVTTKKMFQMAYKNGYAVGAFNVNNMEITQGIVEAVAIEKAPLILQISKGARQYANVKYLRKLIDAALETSGDLPIVIEQPAPAETLPGFKQYVYVEQMPAPVRSVSPEYPAIAKEAGVSGLVVAHLLVGRDGHVLEVRIDEQHGVLMLNEAAVRAARQWVFTPALANNRPVAVWVAVPFNFRLQ